MKKIISLASILLIGFDLLAQLQTNSPVTGLQSSDLYQLSVNSQQIWVEKFIVKLDPKELPDWFKEPYVVAPQEIHIANFNANGRIKVSVTISRAFTNVYIRPISRKITPTISNNILSLTMDAPDYLCIEIDNLPPLFLFANPFQNYQVSATDPKVHYFGPGIHKPGIVNLQDNEIVYISSGAIVYGGIRANNASNIKLIGQGILDGNFEFSQMIHLVNCTNVLFDGPIIRHGKSWTITLVNCNNVKLSNLKVISFGPTGDGVDPLGCKNVEISNCFFRCTDDCIAIKSPAKNQTVKNINIHNCIMIGFAYSDGFTIGFETNGRFITNVAVQDCDILMARGGSRVGGHSAFSIVCDGPAKISNVIFDNIHVEKAENKLFELIITDGTKYGKGPPGHIENVLLKKINWLHNGPILISGFDTNHLIQNVKFINCAVGNKPLTFEMVKTNEFTKNIEVK